LRLGDIRVEQGRVRIVREIANLRHGGFRFHDRHTLSTQGAEAGSARTHGSRELPGKHHHLERSNRSGAHTAERDL